MVRSCPHLISLKNFRLDPNPVFQKIKHGLECNVCESSCGELWLCLNTECLQILCSDSNHALEHFQGEQTHWLQVNLVSFRVWCYQCNMEILFPNGPSNQFDPAENFLDQEDDEPAPEPKGLTGLQNIGNTCYMNAALQALSNCPPLVYHFLQRNRLGAQADQSRSLAKGFHRLMSEMWSSRRPGAIAPTAILYAIRNSHPMFRGFHQHDTQEFLRCLMDQLHEELKVPQLEPSQKYNLYGWEKDYGAGGEEGGAASSQSEGEEYETCDSGVSERSSLSDEPSPKPTSISRTPSPSQDLHRMNRIPQHGSPSRRKHLVYRSIISDVFDGRLISSVQCLTCNRISTRVETFQDLSLPIPNRDHLTVLHQASLNAKCSHLYPAGDQAWWSWLWDWVCSWFWGPTVGLHDCLSAFFSADELKGDNMYSCEKCNKLRNGIKFSRVLECPEVLCIHLKRFRHELMFSSKITNYVTFPMEGLDLAPYLHNRCPSDVTVYELTSVICHHGAAGGGGHYTCYALNAESRLWYEFDDQSVRQVSPDTVRNSEAYVLFYRKESSEVNRIRRRAARLEELSKSEEPRYLISADWLERFNTFAEPGPIENRRLLCPHGSLAPEQSSAVLSTSVWAFLHDKFGGGPVCRMEDLSPCEQCSDQSGEFNLLRVQLHEFNRLRDCGSDTRYAISRSWLADWESYVKGESSLQPGPISNSSLTEQDSTEVYCELSGGQWDLLFKLYKGGPSLPIKDNTSDLGKSDQEETQSAKLDSGCWLQQTQSCEQTAQE